MKIFLMFRTCSSVAFKVGSWIDPISKSARPAMVSVSERTCSWISLCIKCRYSPFSAETGSQGMVWNSCFIFSPSRVITSRPSRLTTAIWCDSRKTISLVCSRIAGRSDATYISPSPFPITTPPALPILAAMILSGSFLFSTTIP